MGLYQAGDSGGDRSASRGYGSVLVPVYGPQRRIRSGGQEGNDPQEDAYEAEPAVDEVILKDKRRLVVLDYGGGTDLDGIKEAVDAFKEEIYNE